MRQRALLRVRLIQTLAAFLASGACWAASAAPGQADFWTPEAQERLKEGLEGRESAVARKRVVMAREAELHLFEGRPSAAEALLDDLALQLHSPDVELALVRSYMQAGDYRRALAFCAHTAGAHREIGAGAALYAWLLQMGGQAARAHEVLEAALKLSPEDADLLEARAALAQPWPQPGPRLMRAPQRFAPYAWGAPADDPPPSAAVVGTATLSADGRHAFVPAAMLQSPGRVWLRNGLGQTVTAERASTEAPPGVAVLDLRSPLPPSAGLAQVPREPFAGAPAYVAEYANRPGPEALPAWPTLRVGFFGRPLLARGERLLGVELPSGGRGGPVFDAQGRWAGIAFLGADGRDRMISALELAPIGGQVNSATGPTAALPWDAVYEIAQRMSLQVLRPTGESTLR